MMFILPAFTSLNSYRSFRSAWLATSANEILVLGDVFWFEADAEQVEPEFATVALNPMNLKNKIKIVFKLLCTKKLREREVSIFCHVNTKYTRVSLLGKGLSPITGTFYRTRYRAKLLHSIQFFIGLFWGPYQEI
jgi:hypothetical protein